MYIVCSSDIASPSMMQTLTANNIDAVSLNLMQITFDEAVLMQLQQNIHTFSHVIIPSPAIIDYVAHIIKSAHNVTFLTVGLSSAEKIQHLTANNVLYPKNSVGGSALFTEVIKTLDLNGANILLLKGQGGNLELEIQLDKSHIPYSLMHIYKSSLQPIDGVYVKKLLTMNQLQGIIITSSTLARWLFTQVEHINCMQQLQHIVFLTTHAPIKHTLQQLGAKRIVLVEDMLHLIKLLHEA